MTPEVLEAVGLLPVQLADGLGFWPFTDVALVTDEFEGRVTVVARDGTLAHRPGPVQFPTLVPIREGVLANPLCARKRGHNLLFPGGWRFPQNGDLPRLPVFTPKSHAVRVAHRTIELGKMRAIASDDRKVRITLDDTSFTVSREAAIRFAETLGLPSLDHVEPLSDKHAAMYRLGLRDFPYVLLEAPAAELRRVFGHSLRSCIANLLWEAARHRWRGQPLDYGTEFRGFYYRPILPVVNRLEARRTLALVMSEIRSLLVERLDLTVLGREIDPLYRLYADVVADLVGEARLLTLRDLGFEPARPDLRVLGTKHPDLLLVVEKASLEADARRLVAEFGVSMVVLGGMARWEAAEPLADMLRPVLGGRPVRLVTYGDYDPAGWVIDDVLVNMLARYDITAEIVGRLILPSRFTKREIELVAEPIPMDGHNRSLSEAWMKRTHGIHGKQLGIHADHLRPYARVRQAFVEETGLA